MFKHLIPLLVSSITTAVFFLSVYLIARPDASYFSLPFGVLNSWLRYFIMSVVFGAMMNFVLSTYGNKSHQIILTIAIAGVVFAGIIYSVARHDTVLIVTPALAIIPGTLIGWDAVTLFLQKRQPQAG